MSTDKSAVHERILEAQFGACQTNDNLERVLTKVSLLNNFYSTNIFDTFSVAEHIVGLQIDSRLDNGDLSLVVDLASIPMKGKVRRFNSFASKYCSWHRPKMYPIYDSVIVRLLCAYRDRDGFAKFTATQLQDYPTLVRIVNAFRQHYALQDLTYKEIDMYLWSSFRAG